ncbi:hypothetical protein ACQJBY_021194 [Aegilops geniculata]
MKPHQADLILHSKLRRMIHRYTAQQAALASITSSSSRRVSSASTTSSRTAVLIQVDLNERVVGSDLPNESHNKAEEYAPLSAMQELHPSVCAGAKECYTGLSSPQEKMVAKKAHIENFGRVNQGSAESILPDKQITTQELHPSFSVSTKKDYTGLSLPHMVAKKARVEKFDKANQGRAKYTKEGYTNQGSAESAFPDKQITAQELHPSFSSRTKEDYTGSSLPHMVAKKAHIEKIHRVNEGCAESNLPDKTNQELHPSNYARTKEGCTSLSSPHEHTVAKKAHAGPEAKNGHAENNNATKQGKKTKINHSYTTSKQASKHWVAQDLEKECIAGARSYYRRISL